MPNLDIANLGTLTPDHFKVLGAIETIQKRHSVAASEFIQTASHVRGGDVFHLLADLHRKKLIQHSSEGGLDAWLLTQSGLDYLALNTLMKRGIIRVIGSRIGVGKEADVYMALSPVGERIILKFHKLGRTSFKSVRSKRNYAEGRQSKCTWTHLSCLSATREYGFMIALKERGFPVPRALGLDRHLLVMEYIDGTPFHEIRQFYGAEQGIEKISNEKEENNSKIESEVVYMNVDQFMEQYGPKADTNTTEKEEDEDDYSLECSKNDKGTEESDKGDEEQNQNIVDNADKQVILMDEKDEKMAIEESISAYNKIIAEKIVKELHAWMVKMAVYGVVHGDCNEYNVIITPQNQVKIIDFPQMISTKDPEAEEQFNRDIKSVKDYVRRRFGLEIDLPHFKEVVQEIEYTKNETQEKDKEIDEENDMIMATEKFARSQIPNEEDIENITGIEQKNTRQNKEDQEQEELTKEQKADLKRQRRAVDIQASVKKAIQKQKAAETRKLQKKKGSQQQKIQKSICTEY